MKTGNREKAAFKLKMGCLILLPAIICLFTTTCTVRDEKDNSDSPNSFTKIYDDPNYDNDYYPCDIKQDSDGGYIILARSAYPYSPYLLKINQAGKKEWGKKIDQTYDDPIREIHIGEDGYYFFCEYRSSSNPVLLRVKQNEEPTEEAVFYGSSPVSASFLSGKEYLLITTTGHYSWSPTYIKYTQDDIDGVKYPYGGCGYSEREFHLTGKIGDEYFYYQTYSKQDTGNESTFPNKNDPCFKLRISGLDSGPFECDINIPFIALKLHNIPAPTDCDNLKVSGAIEREGAERKYIEFIINGTINGTSRMDVRELSATYPVYIEEMNIDNKDYIFFAGTTVFQSIKLYAYDLEAPNVQPKTKIFGVANSYYAYGLIKTTDNGLAILGETYVSSAGSRICLIKLSEKDLIEMVRGN